MKKRLVRILSVVCCVSLILVMLSGCGNGEKEESTEKNEEQKEIVVMVPPWAEPSGELLQEFTDKTGIKAVINIVGWDDIRNKVSIAAAGETAPADVIEVDWSWVGEFGAADWFEPIEMSEEEIEGMPTVKSFMYNDQIIALPYANDFRLAYYNIEHFEKVGITEAPKTWDEVYEACKKIKEQGISSYPVAMTLSATEASTTSLFWMTLSKYGDIFNDDFTLNQENVLEALKFVNKLVNEDKLIDPASENMKDVEVYGKLTAGAASFMVGPTYYIGLINNPDESQIAGKSSAMLVPGNGDIKTATFALPEGIGISKYSENKEAAKEFINWYTSPEVQIKMYGEKGNIPTRTEALQQLIDNGDIEGGEVLIEQSGYIASPFPGGIPNWYSEMSNTIYNSVNQMVQGAMSPEQACENIEKKVAELK